MKNVLLILTMLISGSVLAADKTPQELMNIGIDEKLGQKIDQTLKFKNEFGHDVELSQYFNKGKPVVLLLAYYGCPNLCNLFLNGVTDSFKTLKWIPGRDFEAVTVSFDPSENADLALKKKSAHIAELNRATAENGWHFLVNDKILPQEDNSSNAKKLADQVGFKYRWDKDTAQFAHSATMVFLTPDGKIARYLYGIEFKDQDLRFALQETTGGRIGNIVDRFLLFCYNYDPKTRKYTLYAMNLMRAGGGLTTVLLCGWIFAFRRRNKRETFKNNDNRPQTLV